MLVLVFSELHSGAAAKCARNENLRGEFNLGGECDTDLKQIDTPIYHWCLSNSFA